MLPDEARTPHGEMEGAINMGRHKAPVRRGALLRKSAVPIGLIASGALVWNASYAAFTATTVNPGNSWSTGSVALSDSQGGSSSGATGTALWSGQTNLIPGSTGTKCIKVTY